MNVTEHESNIIREDLIKAITGLEDPKERAILGLVLRISDSQDRLIHEAFQKLERVIQDEGRLRTIVLNGHVDNHEVHHDWLEKNLIQKNTLENIVQVAREHNENKHYCVWAAQKMKEEEEAKNDNKGSKRKIIEALVIYAILFIAGVNYNSLINFIRGNNNADSSVPSTHSYTRP